jgi:hypothetical protein
MIAEAYTFVGEGQASEERGALPSRKTNTWQGSPTYLRFHLCSAQPQHFGTGA